MILRSAIALLVVVFGSLGGPAIAQEPARPASVAKPTVTALMIDVTIARRLGDKVLSSTPYQLAVIPDLRASLRIGGDVPVPTTTITPGQNDTPAKTMASFSYRTIGTNIDVLAGAGADGQFRLTLTIEESSIYAPEQAPPSAKVTGAPAFRSFKSNNNIALRDGQSLDYVMATDRISGEVYRVSVKLTVVK
ncbi:MAG: hypothetical protein ACRD1W_01800 [Vicinamibacterales bacterium]